MFGDKTSIFAIVYIGKSKIYKKSKKSLAI